LEGVDVQSFACCIQESIPLRNKEDF